MYMCTLTSSLGPAFRTARVVYRVSGYIHKGAHTTAAACGMLILFILECAAEECAANFNGVYIPPPPPPPKKNGPCLNERILVLVNASAHLFLNSRKELVLQQDFKRIVRSCVHDCVDTLV